jgi:hypothetical protein
VEAKDYWERYEKGIQYNSSFKPNKDYYESIKVWNDFYNGDQWNGVGGSSELPKLVFNYTKRIIDFKIASVTSSDISVNVEPLRNTPVTDSEQEIDNTDFVNNEIKNVFEKWNFRILKKRALRKAGISGDMCAHITFNTEAKPFRGFAPDVIGEMEIELIDATNIYFGNANIKSVSKQPYIIIVGRDTVQNLQEEAKQFKAQDNDIRSDDDTEYQLTEFANVEVEPADIEKDSDGKAKYIYYYYKKKVGEDIHVFVTKCTKDAIIYQDIDTGYSDYPVAFANWYELENTYHGRGEVEGICPNQIAINKMFAMIVYHQMMTAFPTAVYDKDVIKNWNNQIGTAFALSNLNGRSIKDVAGYLNPANMSDYIIKVIDLAIQYTKECMGVSDASLGNIDPKNTSAILAVQKSTAVPLENVKDNLYDFVEQIVRIMIDVMGTKYGKRPVVITDEDRNRTMEKYDFAQLKGMDLHIGIDVGESSYYSEIAMLQTMDNLLQGQYIEFIDYLERIPNEMFPKKAEYIAQIKAKQQQEKEASYEQLSQYMLMLPAQYQKQFAQAIDNLISV